MKRISGKDYVYTGSGKTTQMCEDIKFLREEEHLKTDIDTMVAYADMLKGRISILRCSE